MTARVLLFAVLSLLPAGCNIIGAAAIVAKGPPKVEALHELDPDRPTIVVVDDGSNRLPRRSLRQTIADEATRLLLKERAVRVAIEPKAAYDAMTADRAGQKLSVVELARAAQAEVVVWANIDEFTLSPDGVSFAPRATLRVKVLDATLDENNRIWPEEPDGQTLTASIRQTSRTSPQVASQIQLAELSLAQVAGKGISQMFYRHLASDDAASGR